MSARYIFDDGEIEPEYKMTQATNQFSAMDSNAVFLGVCTPSIGPGRSDAVGRRIRITKFQLRGQIYPNWALNFTNNLFVRPQFCRMILFVDTQPTISPTQNAVLDGGTVTAFPELNNRLRFQILYDNFWSLGAYRSETVTNLTSISKYMAFDHSQVGVEPCQLGGITSGLGVCPSTVCCISSCRDTRC